MSFRSMRFRRRDSLRRLPFSPCNQATGANKAIVACTRLPQSAVAPPLLAPIARSAAPDGLGPPTTWNRVDGLFEIALRLAVLSTQCQVGKNQQAAFSIVVLRGAAIRPPWHPVVARVKSA